MAKKLLALFTVVCLLATLVVTPIVANAATTTKPSGMIVYEDDFDTTAIGNYNLTDGSSPLPSEVFSAPNTTIASGYGQIMVDPDDTNNHVFRAHPTESDIRSLYTKALDLGSSANSGTWYSFSYDFKMSQTNANFYIAHDLFQLSNGSYIFTTTDTPGSTTAIRQYEANKWYHVEILAHGNTLEGWLFGADGTLLASNTRTYSTITADTNTKTTSEENKLCAYSINAASGNNRAGLITLDNAKLTEFDTTTAYPMFVTDPDVSGSTPVPTETTTVSVVSDQIIDLTNSGDVKIAKSGSGNRTCSIVVTKNPYIYKVTLPDALEEDATYTLDLSGLKNNSGIAAGDNAKFTFETAAGAIKLESTAPADKAENVNVELKEMTITFTSEATVYPATVTITGGDETITATVTKVSGTEFTLSWADRDADLKGETTYTVQLVGFKDSGENEINTSVSFKTENTGIITLSDGFESGAHTDGYGYNTSQSNDYLFTTGNPHTQGMISHVAGYTGNALQLQTGGSESGQCMNSIRTTNTYTATTYVNDEGETEYEQFLLTYRVNLKEPSKNTGEVIKHKSTDTETYTKGGTKILIAATTDGSMSNQTNIAQFTSDENGIPYIGHDESNAGDEPVALQADHWYNVIWSVSGPYQRFALVDDATGKLVWSTEKDFSNYFTTGDAIKIYPLGAARTTYGSNQVYNDSQTLLLDDFTFQRIKPWKNDHALSIEDIAQTTIAPDGDLTVEFSRPTIVDPYDMFLYEIDGSDNKKTAYSTATVTYPDFNTRKISLSNLKYGRSYELDCSGLTDVSGSPAAEDCVIEFTTSDNASDLSIYDGVTCTGLDQGDTVNFKLLSKAADSVSLLVAFYNRSSVQSLEGVQVVNNYSLSAGENDVAITLTANMQKAEYIKVFALDDVNNLVPLIEACEIVAPKKSVKVLMIGTSMTEDTGRYLYDVAAAGELDLDLTVKGIGGSNLSMHARNIAAELAGRTGADNIQMTEDARAEYNEGVANGTVDEDFDWNPRVRYFTYKNGRYIDPDDADYTSDMASLVYTLKNEQFDVISINQASSGGCDPDIESLKYILGEIRKLQPDAQLVIHQTWFGWNTSDTDPARRYGIFTKGIEPVIDMFANDVPSSVPNITYGNSPVTIIPAGRAFYIADRKYEDIFGVKYPSISTNDRPGEALYEEAEFAAATGLLRDSAHGSYYGCYLADACWYEFLTGKIAPVTNAEGEAAIAKPDSISAEEHIARLELLRDVAHEAMLAYK